MESDSISNSLEQPARPTTLSPRLRQSNQQHTTKSQVRLRLMTKTKTTPKTTTNKTTTIRCSSFLDQSTVETPQHESNHIKRTRSNCSNHGLSGHTQSECHTSSSRHRCKGTFFQAARDLSGTLCLTQIFALCDFPSPTREEPRPKHGP